MTQIFDETVVAHWNSMVGAKVWKNQSTDTLTEPKPFKSGNKINTVKNVVIHPQTKNLGFTFEEDESVDECWRCSIAPDRHKIEESA